jgi:methionyl-tRNA formyltransferase
VLRTQVADGAGAPGVLLDQRGTVACGAGAVRLALVQRAGRPPVAADDFLRGARLATGASLAGAAAS